jgi:hypothetical protein
LTADGRIETARMRGEPEPGDAVLRILVELADVDDPRVWRQLLVPAKVILADPTHEKHHAMLEWLGLRSATKFAPARFVPDEADMRLLRLTAP